MPSARDDGTLESSRTFPHRLTSTPAASEGQPMFRQLFAIATVLLIASWLLALTLVASDGGRPFIASPGNANPLAFVAEYYDAINHQIRTGSPDSLHRILREDPDDSEVSAIAKREALDRRVRRIRAISAEASISFDASAVTQDLVIVQTHVTLPDSAPHLLGLDVAELSLWPEFESLRIFDGRVSTVDTFFEDEFAFSGLDPGPGGVVFDAHQIIDPLLFSFIDPGDKQFIAEDSGGFIIPLKGTFSIELITNTGQSGSIANRVQTHDLIETERLQPGTEVSIVPGSIVTIPPESEVVLTLHTPVPAVVLGLEVSVKNTLLYDNYGASPMKSDEPYLSGTATIVHAWLLPSQIVGSHPFSLHIGMVVMPPGSMAFLDPATEVVILLPIEGESGLQLARSDNAGIDSESAGSFVIPEELPDSTLPEHGPSGALASYKHDARHVAHSAGVRFATEPVSGFIFNSSDEPAAAWIVALYPVS